MSKNGTAAIPVALASTVDGALYREFNGLVVWWCRRLLAPRYDGMAEDVAHNVWVRIMKYYPAGIPSDRKAAILKTTATRATFDALKREGKRQSLLDLDGSLEPDDFPVPNRSHLDDGVADILLGDLATAIARDCSPMHRTILKLSLEDRTQVEIGDLVGLKQPTVSKYLQEIEEYAIHFFLDDDDPNGGGGGAPPTGTSGGKGRRRGTIGAKKMSAKKLACRSVVNINGMDIEVSVDNRIYALEVLLSSRAFLETEEDVSAEPRLRLVRSADSSCDGLDDDCDGPTDERFGVAPGAGTALAAREPGATYMEDGWAPRGEDELLSGDFVTGRSSVRERRRGVDLARHAPMVPKRHDIRGECEGLACAIERSTQASYRDGGVQLVVEWFVSLAIAFVSFLRPVRRTIRLVDRLLGASSARKAGNPTVRSGYLESWLIKQVGDRLLGAELVERSDKYCCVRTRAPEETNSTGANTAETGSVRLALAGPDSARLAIAGRVSAGLGLVRKASAGLGLEGTYDVSGNPSTSDAALVGQCNGDHCEHVTRSEGACVRSSYCGRDELRERERYTRSVVVELAEYRRRRSVADSASEREDGDR